MVTTANDVGVYMNAVIGPDYLFFRIYEMPVATVTAHVDMAIRYMNEMISVATQTAKPAVYDDLTKTEACLRISEQIYGEYMATGFSWSTLNDSVNTSNFSTMIQGMVTQYKNQKESLLSMLKVRYDLSTQENWGPDSYGVINNNFIQTSPWRVN